MSDHVSHPPSPPTLLTLPFDIHHLLITDHLPRHYTSLTSLRATCAYFALHIPPRLLRRIRRRAIRSLAKREAVDYDVWFGPVGPGQSAFAYFPLYLACYSCVERVPRWGFVECMTRNQRVPERCYSMQRWCKPCGAKNGKARAGVWYRESSFDERDMYQQSPAPSTLRLRGGIACMRCTRRDPPWELLWGCGDCFRNEKARRRDLELFQASMGRQIPAATATWLKERMSRWSGSHDRTGSVRGGKAPTGQSGVLRGTSSEMPRRETRCKDCWRFPVRRKGDKADAAYEGVDWKFWCEPCRGLLTKAAEKGEKITDVTSVR